MFCIYIHHGSECREDMNCEFLLMFLCFVRLPDKHIGREGMRVTQREKKRRRWRYWGHKGVFFGSDSDYWLRQNGDVSTGFTKDGGIEGETEGGWR